MRRNFLVHGNRPGAEARIQRNFYRELPPILSSFPLARNVFTGVVLTEKSPSLVVNTCDRKPR